MSRRLLKLKVARKGTDCVWCGRKTFERREGEPMMSDTRTLEHMVHKSRGGSDSVRNLRIACHRCNQARADRLEIQARTLADATPNPTTEGTAA